MRTVIVVLVFGLLAASAWGAWRMLASPQEDELIPSSQRELIAQAEPTDNEEHAGTTEPDAEAPVDPPSVLLPRDETGRVVRDVTPEDAVAWPETDEPLVRLPAVEPPPEPERPPDWRRLPRPVIEEAGAFQSEGLTVRLADVTPPALDHACEGRPCGVQARAALRRFVRGRSVECMMDETARSGEHEAQCRFGKTDIAAWMAENGWVVEAEGDYAALLDEAKAAGRGLYRR